MFAASPALSTAIATLGAELLQILIIEYLARYHPVVLHTAPHPDPRRWPGDSETFWTDPQSASPRLSSHRPRIRFDRLPLLLQNPLATLRDEYLRGRRSEHRCTRAEARCAAVLRFKSLVVALGGYTDNGGNTAGAVSRDPARTFAFRFYLPAAGGSSALGHHHAAF